MLFRSRLSDLIKAVPNFEVKSGGDGSRVAFKPYPTPLFNDAGELTGAVNMLIDVTEEQSAALHQQAEHCRRLAEATYDRNTSKVLGDMADGLDRTAGGLSVTSKPVLRVRS